MKTQSLANHFLPLMSYIYFFYSNLGVLKSYSMFFANLLRVLHVFSVIEKQSNKE